MSAGPLFSKPALFTIDTSSFLEIFRDDGRHSKKHFPSLWNDVCQLIADGTMLSHVQVYNEISPGDELHTWAKANKDLFLEYDLPAEGDVIKSLTGDYKDFVNAKVKPVNADPWLIAQAKVRGLTIVTEEVGTTGFNKPKPRNMRIPDVCGDPIINVRCITLLGLIQDRGWKY